MFIAPDDSHLQYMGRIDFDDPKAPTMMYAASCVRMKFTGTRLAARMKNKWGGYSNTMGLILDGEQSRVALDIETGEEKTYALAENLSAGEHEALLFKRQDSCHMVTFLGFEIEDGARILNLPPLPERRIEVFGDSVSCGEVCEATDYVGKVDPEHNGQYSNSWYSYAWITARKIGAQLHDTSQGGIALLDGSGYFNEPNYLGVESSFDKINYNPYLAPLKDWDFGRYTPHVVIVAIGQNDAHPEDYMAEDYDSDKSQNWRSHYQAFIEKLMGIYPKATIILTTTILMHDPNWDRSIEEVCQKINNPRVTHFLYTRNGTGTPGHIRIPEAEEMAEELSAYIEGMGESIWR